MDKNTSESGFSSPTFYYRLSLIAFCSTLIVLGLAAILGLLAFRLLGHWMFGGAVNPTAERLAMLAAMCLFTAVFTNATALVAALVGWWKGQLVSWSVVCLSGLGLLPSVACGISLLP